MPDNTTEYRAKYTQIMQVPAPDDLIHGWYTAAKILISGKVSLKRGALLMSSGGNVFVAATSSGIATADELCILCEDVELDAGLTAQVEGYFSGEFSGSRVLLGWETEEDDHAALVEEIKPTLRKHKLMVK